MRAYISGGMSGIPEEVYTRRFMAAERYAREHGYKVSNPVRWGWLMKHLPYKVALALDILMMCRCDTVFMISGWTESRGATAEHTFAKATGMDIKYLWEI